MTITVRNVRNDIGDHVRELVEDEHVVATVHGKTSTDAYTKAHRLLDALSAEDDLGAIRRSWANVAVLLRDADAPDTKLRDAVARLGEEIEKSSRDPRAACPACVKEGAKDE